MNLEERIAFAENILGYTFESKQLIQAAITHPSAVEGQPVSASYERLEFLGDSILGAIIATDMFEKFPGMDEGALTRMKISLVSGKTLSCVAEELGIGKCIIFGESEKGTGVRGFHSALENVYESLVGAVYLEGGYDPAASFIRKTLSPYMVPELAKHPISPKSRLQEICQQRFHTAPVYQLEKESGPAHAPQFTSAVFVDGEFLGRGSGLSKKESQSVAASFALDKLDPKDEALLASKSVISNL